MCVPARPISDRAIVSDRDQIRWLPVRHGGTTDVAWRIWVRAYSMRGSWFVS